MRHALALSCSAIAILLLSITACGDDKIERGLTVDDEVAAPSSDQAMDESQKERDQQLDEVLEEGPEH